MLILSALALAVVAQFQDQSQQVSTLALMRAPQTGSELSASSLARFSDLPDVLVTYYDVTGHDISEIHRSLSKHAPHDRVTQQPMPATSTWSVKAALKSLTSGKRCTISAAKFQFHAMATMPRLLIGKDVAPETIAAWNNYVARLEARQARQLRFAYDHLGEAERAVVGASCDRANAVADAALGRIKAQQLKTQESEKKAVPRLEQPQG